MADYCPNLACANYQPCSKHGSPTGRLMEKKEISDARMLAEKSALRSQIRKQLRGASFDANVAGSLILKYIRELSAWQNASTISVFLSYGNEPDTTPIVLQAFAENKTVLIPAWDSKTLTMDMVPTSLEEYHRLKALQAPKSIPMPAMTGKWEQVDLFIVPGLLFDRSGGRLGHGWGYYDRYFSAYLSQFRMTPTLVGIAQVMQVSDTPVPIEPHDHTVHFLVTPEWCLKCG